MTSVKDVKQLVDQVQVRAEKLEAGLQDRDPISTSDDQLRLENEKLQAEVAMLKQKREDLNERLDQLISTIRQALKMKDHG